MRYLFLVSLLTPIVSYAQTELDEAFLDLGIIDQNHQIIDISRFDELMRQATNQVTPMLPLRVDSATTVRGFLLNRFGLYSMYQFDNIETKKQANDFMKNGILTFYKNYICSLKYSQSLTFKNNQKMNINLSIVNSKNEVIYTSRFHFSEC